MIDVHRLLIAKLSIFPAINHTTKAIWTGATAFIHSWPCEFMGISILQPQLRPS